MDTLEAIDWACDTIRNRLQFGMGDSKEAAYSREKRAKGVLMDCKKEIEELSEAVKKIALFKATGSVHEDFLNIRDIAREFLFDKEIK